jgi:glucokinase
MYLGIEIGGTKLQLGIGDGQHPTLLAEQRLAIDPRGGAEGIRAQLAAAVPEMLSQHAVRQLGIGFGGPVLGGVTLTSHQVTGWDQFPLADWCRQQFGVPTALGNDCDAAALAEAAWGAGKGGNTVFYVTVGTGVGGGLVLRGRLHGEGRPAVAEIGHLRPGPRAVDPHQTVESLASGWGITESARRQLAEASPEDPERQALEQACQGGLEQLDCQHLGTLASAGNSIAQRAIAIGIETLGWAIAQVVTLTSADVIVVGGGVSLMGEEQFFGPLRNQVATYVFPPLRDAYRVVPAELGEWVVVHGAIALARQADTGHAP